MKIKLARCARQGTEFVLRCAEMRGGLFQQKPWPGATAVYAIWFKADLPIPSKSWKEIWMDRIKNKWRQDASNESNVPSCWTGKGHLPRPPELTSGVGRYMLYLTVLSGLFLGFNGAEIWKANRCDCLHYPPNPGALYHNMPIIYIFPCDLH